jgi:hypothetical protein
LIAHIPKLAPAAPGTPVEERILRRIIRNDDPNECWGWNGGVHPKGYAAVTDNKTGESVYIHRFMYEREVGPVPPGLFVCHHCDNPPCSNPRHLFLGTHDENMQDSARKLRRLRKLAIRDVIGIKKALELGIHAARIAKRFGVNHHNVECIRAGEIHKYITPDRFNFDTVEVRESDFPLLEYRSGRNPGLIPAIKAVRDGMGICEAARKFGVNLGMLSRVKNGKYRRSLEEMIEMNDKGYDGNRISTPKRTPSKPKPYLSPRQRQVMSFVRKCILEEYCPPTLRDICSEMGVTSTNGARTLLAPLFRRKLIEKTEHKSRGIRLTELGRSDRWDKGA